MTPSPSTLSTSGSTGPLGFRCPACGQQLEDAVVAFCPLCGFPIGDDRATGDDVTPFAAAHARGECGWWPMCKWVWLAGMGRLKHLALMRSSAAARAFARLNVLYIAFALALLQGSVQGWRRVTSSPALEPTGSIIPAGRGWLHMAATPPLLRQNKPVELPVDLWWNPAQGVVAAVLGLLAGLLFMWLALVLLRAGVTRAHQAVYRREQRMTAALLYGTAWGLPLSAAVVVGGLRPISRIGAIAGWTLNPPELGFTLGGGLAVALAGILWWFWLVRLGGTAPASTRGRVIAFFIGGAPMILIAAAAGWWYGVNYASGVLFAVMNLQF